MSKKTIVQVEGLPLREKYWEMETPDFIYRAINLTDLLCLWRDNKGNNMGEIMGLRKVEDVRP